jgi:hypothetical protein
MPLIAIDLLLGAAHHKLLSLQSHPASPSADAHSSSAVALCDHGAVRWGGKILPQQVRCGDSISPWRAAWLCSQGSPKPTSASPNQFIAIARTIAGLHRAGYRPPRGKRADRGGAGDLPRDRGAGGDGTAQTAGRGPFASGALCSAGPASLIRRVMLGGRGQRTPTMKARTTALSIDRTHAQTIDA